MSIRLVGHEFRDPELPRRALTHRSAGSRNNERLEFLGDALVNLIVAEALYQRWPRADEGDLTRARAALVREGALAGIARELQLGDRLDHRPGRLSGGEQQRVAIARAVANAPRVLLADEPTGNLDSATAEAVFQQLLALVRETGMAALVATHNPELAARMDRTVRLKDGVLDA